MARRLDAFALVDADLEQLADEAFVGVGAQQRQRIAAFRRLEPHFALSLPIGHLSTPVERCRQRPDAIFRENRLQIGACCGVTGVGVEIDAGL